MPFLQRQINHLTQENGKNWVSWKAICFPFSSHLHVTCTNFWLTALFLVNQFREDIQSSVERTTRNSKDIGVCPL